MKSQPKSYLLRLACIAFVGIATLAAGHRLAQAQEPPPVSPEVQQLKEKLQKLEQTVEALKNQLSAMEQPAKTPTPAAMITPKAESPAVTVVRPATTTTTGGTNQEKTGENTFSVYGFAMLDAGYQFNQNDPDWFDTVRPAKLPAFEDQFAPDGKTFFGVRQSRLGVKSTTATKYGELKTTFEVELFGVGPNVGQTTFRLRHAYGELGQFGAGQYWSVLVDPDAFPNTVEYWGPNGLVWYRNVQFRWMPVRGKNALTIGIERPGASGDGGLVADRIELSGIRAKFDLPDLTGNVRFTRDWGHVQIGGILRRIKWADTLDDAFDLGGSDVGWGFAVSAIPKFNANNTGRFQALYGEGVQNYLNDGPVDVALQRTNSSDPRRPIEGVALPTFAFSAYLDHTWSKRFSSSIGYSLVNFENTDGQAPSAFHRGQYASTNLLFYPVENTTIGAEYIWGRRANFQDGFSSEDNRIQFVFKYNFSKLFSF